MILTSLSVSLHNIQLPSSTLMPPDVTNDNYLHCFREDAFLLALSNRQKLNKNSFTQRAQQKRQITDTSPAAKSHSLPLLLPPRPRRQSHPATSKRCFSFPSASKPDQQAWDTHCGRLTKINQAFFSSFFLFNRLYRDHKPGPRQPPRQPPRLNTVQPRCSRRILSTK